MVGLLHHFPNYQPVINEIRRVLKKDGMMIAVEPNLLNWTYLKSFKLVHKKKGVTPNEFPLNPIELANNLETHFSKITILPFRELDVPFLRQIGWLGKNWIGIIVKKIILIHRKLFVSGIKKGTFFIMCCTK